MIHMIHDRRVALAPQFSINFKRDTFFCCLGDDVDLCWCAVSSSSRSDAASIASLDHLLSGRSCSKSHVYKVTPTN